MLFDKLALAESISSLPAANGIQNHPLTAKASPNAKVLRRKTIAVDSIHGEAEQIDSGVLGNDSAAHHRHLQDTICGVPSAFFDEEGTEEPDYAALAQQVGPICEGGYTKEDGSTQPLADCFAESGAVPEAYAATYAGQVCMIALCADSPQYCCSYQQMCKAYGDPTDGSAQAATCALAGCCYENGGSTETCFQGSYPTTSCSPDDGDYAYAYTCCLYGEMCDQQSSRAAAYPVASWETACEVAECCKETDKNLISCQLQLLPQLVATTTATTPLGTEAAVTEPQTTEATAAADNRSNHDFRGNCERGRGNHYRGRRSERRTNRWRHDYFAYRGQDHRGNCERGRGNHYRRGRRSERRTNRWRHDHFAYRGQDHHDACPCY